MHFAFNNCNLNRISGFRGDTPSASNMCYLQYTRWLTLQKHTHTPCVTTPNFVARGGFNGRPLVQWPTRPPRTCAVALEAPEG